MLKNLYPDSLEASGRYLRIILKEISELKLPYTPIAYSVWYEYASGRNPELYNEIQAAREKKEIIDNKKVFEWFRQYVSDRPLLVTKKQTIKAESLLNGMTSRLTEAGNLMGRQGEQLKAHIEDLNNASSEPDIKSICRDIVLETQRIIDSNTDLRKNVHKTISELDALTLELKNLREAAKTDMLTGLLNRRGFEDAIAKPMKDAQKETAPLTLIIADIDRFKRINDNYGHLTGDNVLKLISRLLQKHIKGKDIAGRFGGEEFIMALPKTKKAGGFALAEQIRTSLEKMRWRSNSSGKDLGTITISLGVAQFIPGEDLAALIARADKALYAAKKNGRNRTATHNGKKGESSLKKNEYIPTSRFRVGKKSPQKFKAILGTCLGLALYDQKRKAGGLIHILLPYPVGNTDFQPDSPGKYASTGIPMLINELTRMGCTTQTLKATIAGGALVGPVSSMDLGLDIGGRSADVARRILKEQGIEILKSETGGFFACTLELDMMTGKTKIASVWETAIAPDAIAPVSGPEAIMATIDDLQPIPQTALKILRMFNQDSYSIDDITQELSQDQVLSARTLQMCNSVLFSGTIKIDTLKDAVMMLGKEMLAKSVITTAIESYFKQTGPSGYSLCKGGLFFHAVGVACLAERLAKETGLAHTWRAYTAGLLHDIGKVVLDQHLSDRLPFFFRTLGDEKQSIIQAEEKVLGFNHCRAGVILAEKWDFSDALTEVIRCHHTPGDAKAHLQLVEIVYLADRVMENFFKGFDIDNIDALHLESIMKKIDLDGASLARCIDDLPLDILIQEPPHGTANTGV